MDRRARRRRRGGNRARWRGVVNTDADDAGVARAMARSDCGRSPCIDPRINRVALVGTYHRKFRMQLYEFLTHGTRPHAQESL